jgi:Flp pilus assembly protein TadD
MSGELHAGRGDAVTARHAFEKLASLVPAHAPAFSNMGELCRLEGDYTAARKFYRQAISLDPFDDAAREGMERVGA